MEILLLLWLFLNLVWLHLLLRSVLSKRFLFSENHICLIVFCGTYKIILLISSAVHLWWVHRLKCHSCILLMFWISRSNWGTLKVHFLRKMLFFQCHFHLFQYDPTLMLYLTMWTTANVVIVPKGLWYSEVNIYHRLWLHWVFCNQ